MHVEKKTIVKEIEPVYVHTKSLQVSYQSFSFKALDVKALCNFFLTFLRANWQNIASFCFYKFIRM